MIYKRLILWMMSVDMCIGVLIRVQLEVTFLRLLLDMVGLSSMSIHFRSSSSPTTTVQLSIDILQNKNII